jgi:hypothetical protein
VDATRPRSLFVTVTAWSLILLAFLSVLAALLLAALWWGALYPEQRALIAEMPMFQLMPPSVRLLVTHLGWVCATLFVTGLLAFPLGEAMRRRRAWSRVASVWICAALSLLHLGAVPWQWIEIRTWFAGLREQLPWFARDSVDSFYLSTQLSSAVVLAAFGLALAWTAWRLSRPAIVAEFVQPDTDQLLT